MNNPNSFNSVLSMPIPRTRLAPEIFRGDFNKVKEFIQHYERLCTQHNISLDTEKCETIIRYCSKREKETIQNIPSFIARDWNRLRSAILKLYDADLATKHYKVRDVRTFTQKQRVKKVRDLAAWKKYCRGFLRIAGALLAEDKISDREYATYFWQGIPKVLRVRLESKILTRNPGRDLADPFDVDEVDTAAESILQRDRFDRVLDDSESEEEDSGEESSSSEEDSSDSDSDEEHDYRRKKKGRSGRKRSVERSGKTETPSKRAVNGSRKEVEGLIRQMNLLVQTDPDYRLAYYKAMKIDPEIKEVMGKPIIPSAFTSPPRQSAQIFQQSVSSPNNIPINSNPNFGARQPSYGRPLPPGAIRGNMFACFGCGERDHGLSNCPIINDMMTKGIFSKDHAGRIIFGDGSPIWRNRDETFLQAYERLKRPSAHFVSIGNFLDEELVEESDDPGYESDLEDEDNWDVMEDVFAIRDIGNDAYAAERPEKQIAARKKQILEGVYPPRLKDLNQGKENRPPVNPDTGRTIRGTRNQPPAAETTRNVPRRVQKPAEPIPIEIDVPRFDGSNDRDIIEDQGKRSKEAKKKPSVEIPEKPKVIEKRPLRTSPIANHVDRSSVLNRLLDARVELAVGEVFGVSRELSTMLADAIKARNVKSQAPVGLTTRSAAVFRTKTRGLLIKITMECDGIPIEAIIDTGSQLNIVNERVCKSVIRRPIDSSASISMNDANGGEGNLEGMVENVPLTFGSVKTRANLYVGAHVPFDLLLGRPWQRGNLVSIDELGDGTYLVFKDPVTMRPKHTVLVTPDSVTQSNWDFDPSTWYASESPIVSLFVNSNTKLGDSQYPRRILQKYPQLEEEEFPELYLGPKGDGKSEFIKQWVRELLLERVLNEPPRREGEESIKPGDIEHSFPSDSDIISTNSSDIMEMKLGPARV